MLVHYRASNRRNLHSAGHWSHSTLHRSGSSQTGHYNYSAWLWIQWHSISHSVW